MERFEAGELSIVADYGDLANPSSPDADLETLMLVPIGSHGLLNIGHSSRAEIDEFERTMVEMVEQATIDALDRVERETEVERQRTELERSNESLQQFAYVASHDLQEPLRMVSSYVSLLEEEYGDDLDDEATQYMEYAVDGATRMQEMIDALLQYSRVHTRGQDFTDVDAGSVFDQTLQSLELLVDDADASISRTEFPAVSADRNQLGQLFQNLVKNAVHHGGEAPTVEVRAEREGAEGNRDGEWVRFTVADDGPGIEPSQHDRIFEIFKQNSSRTDSTGIGLAMCKRIVERHGGEIWVESDPGDGAAFHFTMPLPDDDSQETHV
jgi:light-regulated signal transduction histidine kinase (bacteriophytochrome)